MRTCVAIALFAASGFAQDASPSRADLLRDLGATRYATRRKAVLACRGRREPALVARLREVARGDTHENIRGLAIDVLADRGDAKLLPFIKERLAKDPRPTAKRAALRALGKLPSGGNAAILLGYIEGPLAPAAAEALARLGHVAAFDAIAKALEPDGRAGFGEAIPKALVALDAERGSAVLLAFWKRRAADGRRWAVARALETQNADAVRRAMLAELDTESPARSRLALEVLGATGTRKTAKVLMAAFERKPKLRGLIAGALGRIAAPGTATFLASWLGDRLKPAERREIAHALGQTRDPRVVRQICKQLATETDTITRIRFIEALGRIGDTRAVATIAPYLADETRADQSPMLSSIRPFPWNTAVADVATWAIAKLRDRKEIVPVAGLPSFRNPAGRAPLAKRRADLEVWWKDLRDRASWSFRN